MKNPWDDPLTKALGGEVRRKGNNTRDLRAEAARVVGGAPEVMVKITGFGKGAAHMRAHLAYISRDGEVELENDRGGMYRDRSDVALLADGWAQDIWTRRVDQRDTMHLVLSMPPSTSDEAVRNAVREFAKKTFAENHEYVFALHTDESHPHCHVVVRCEGFDGKRLNPRKADLQAWRDGFAQALRDEGEAAESTPRHSRGVIRKSVRQAVAHIEERTVSKVEALKVREVVGEIRAERSGEPPPEKPWKEPIRAKREETVGAWLEAAGHLAKSNHESDVALAGDIVAFVKAMPALDTEQDGIKKRLLGGDSVQHEAKAKIRHAVQAVPTDGKLETAASRREEADR
jgi:type IV secretory pathway VirD2 relaxase